MADPLQDLLIEAAANGLEELIVRVGRYEGDVAVSWQAVAKFRGRITGPWGVGVRTTQAAAIRAALTDGMSVLTADKAEPEDIFS